MKKKQKNNIPIYLIFILTFIFIYIIITKNTYLFASKKDFMYQHYLIPEYFRTLFYSNLDPFPDFTLNLGSGQNIYYLSYYGLYNPYIALSFLFPQIEMINYLITIDILIILTSTILLFNYLQKNNYSTMTCFIVSFLFLTSAPLIFHAKRHIMFINYFPFLIIGLYAIDKYIENNNFTLLTIVTSLIILSSYYFSIPSIIVLYIFLIYKLIKKNIKITIKKLLTISIPFILGIMITSILIIPTAYILFNGRTNTINKIRLINLLKPSLLQSLLYSPYSIGLTFISVIALIYNMFSKNKSDKFISITCFLILTFPIFNYILNGTLYINEKSLIPFIVLILVLTAELLENIYPKISSKSKIILITYLVASSLSICITNNLRDKLMLREEINDNKYLTTKELINQITKEDKSLYRINNSVYTSKTINKVNNIKEYKTTMYSSTYNNKYIKLYNDILNNPIPTRNKFMISPTNNLLSEILLSEKYIVTENNYNLGLELIKEKNNIKIYRNNNILPFGYATNKIMNIETFNSLNYPNNAINLLNNIVLDNKKDTPNNTITIPKSNINYKIIEYNNLTLSNVNNNVLIEAKPLASMTIELNQNLKDKIIFLRVNNNIENKEDLSIIVNNIENKLTDKRWKYYNDNKTFDYCIYGTNQLKISFKKGKYQLNNFEMYILDYEKLQNINNNINPFIANIEETKGDIIKGKINVTNDNSYFTIQIPYDKGFIIKVDNQKTPYKQTGANFIAFPIKKGNHTITIEYKAPLKTISLLISLTGIIILISYRISKKLAQKIIR